MGSCGIPCAPHLKHHLTCPVLQQGDAEDDKALLMEVAQLRSRRLLRTLAVVQDISDGLMALNDIQGELDVCDWLSGCACRSCSAPAEPLGGVSASTSETWPA